MAKRILRLLTAVLLVIVSSGTFANFSVKAEGSDPVTSVTLSSTTAEIVVETTTALTATVTPSGGQVVWSVSQEENKIALYEDEACNTPIGTGAVTTATVYVKGLDEGTATVTVSSASDPSISASCAVTVTPTAPITQTYAITPRSTTTGGDISADKETAASGDTVTVTIKPLDRYMLEQISSKPAVTFTKTAANTYQFTMPGEAVEVYASFKSAPRPNPQWKTADGFKTGTLTWTLVDGAEKYIVKVYEQGEEPAGQAEVGSGVSEIDFTDDIKNYLNSQPAGSGNIELIGEVTAWNSEWNSEDYTYANSRLECYYVRVNVSPQGAATVTGDGWYVLGETATVTLTPGEEYSLSKVEATSLSDNSDTTDVTESLTDNAFSFQVTDINDGSVTKGYVYRKIDATFVKTTPDEYNITIQDSDNGTVSCELDKAPEDEQVELTISPDSGYGLRRLIITDEDDHNVPCDLSDDFTSAIFTMPASDVTVTAIFMELPKMITINIDMGEGYEEDAEKVKEFLDEYEISDETEVSGANVSFSIISGGTLPVVYMQRTLVRIVNIAIGNNDDVDLDQMLLLGQYPTKHYATTDEVKQELENYEDMTGITDGQTFYAIRKEYKPVSGDNAEWTKGDSSSLKFVAKATIDDADTFGTHYTGFTVDDKSVDANYYTAEEGSVAVTLKPDYLETLSVGSHTLAVSFDDSDEPVNFSFTVKEKSDDPSDDDTTPSSGGSSGKSVTPTDNVVTCQMAGYPSNYSWNEAAKACQPGYIDAGGTFHPYRTAIRTVPNTSDRDIMIHAWIAMLSITIGLFCGVKLLHEDWEV